VGASAIRDASVVGDVDRGEAATGEAAMGEAATGEAATGEAATGEAATGEAATGEAATGGAVGGDALRSGSSVVGGGRGSRAGVSLAGVIGFGVGARAEAGRVVIVVPGSMSFVAIGCGCCGAAVAGACGRCGAGAANALAGVGSVVVASATGLALELASASFASSSLDGTSGTVAAVISKRGVGPVGRDGLGGAADPRTIGVGICVSLSRGIGAWAVGESASQAASVSRDPVDVSSVGVQVVSSTTLASVNSGLASTAIPVNGVATIVGSVS